MDFARPAVGDRRDLRVPAMIAVLALALALALALGLTAAEAYAMKTERDAFAAVLRSERSAHLRTRLSLADSEMRMGAFRTETQVRRDIVSERMLKQDFRAAELRREAELVRLQKLVEANCVTPQSVIAAQGI